MRTITFYSYKGGVGRSLLVANTARYLSTLGKSVYAIDLDLEAPGLHYKFFLDQAAGPIKPLAGVLNLLKDFVDTGCLPDRLSQISTRCDVGSGVGTIHLLRAGTAPDPDYWKLLSAINWHELFYGSTPVGVHFFLELQERIQAEFKPDFLLIDARTGITDLGGVATTLLPDTLVCLSLSSVEHLEGIRAVIRGVLHTSALEGRRLNIVPVLSRLRLRRDVEHHELRRVRRFLSVPTAGTSEAYDAPDIIPLHSEPLMEADEQLLVGTDKSPHDVLLLRDYLRLFSQIIPAEEIRPHVGRLVQSAVARLLDDPDGAESALEALTTYCADEEAYRALLKVYALRKAPLEKTVATAALMWQLRTSRNAPTDVVEQAVRSAYSDPRAVDVQRKHADFAEEVWRALGMKDAGLGIAIANAFLPDRRSRAIQLLSDFVELTDAPEPSAVVRLLDLLRMSRGSQQHALGLVERFKALAAEPQFVAAWARLVVEQEDVDLATRTLADASFNADLLRAVEPVGLYRLLRLAGRDVAAAVLTQALETALEATSLPDLRQLSVVFHAEGRFAEFETRVRGRVPTAYWEELVDEPRRRRRARQLVQ